MAEESLRVLAEQLQEACLRLGLTVATAESCTGGLVASAITDVSGSSGYFRGGVVSYSNDAKIALLGVPQALLSADLAAAVTGVAGPGGGSASKPVGLTYVAVADSTGVDVRRFAWAGDRLENKEASARAALELLLRHANAVSRSADPDPAAGGAPE